MQALPESERWRLAAIMHPLQLLPGHDLTQASVQRNHPDRSRASSFWEKCQLLLDAETEQTEQLLNGNADV